MQAELTPLKGQKAIAIICTTKPMTAWGGLGLDVEFAGCLARQPAGSSRPR
jgi:hypothetical protein